MPETPKTADQRTADQKRRERKAAWKKADREKHPEKYRARAKAYREKYPEKVKAHKKAQKERLKEHQRLVAGGGWEVVPASWKPGDPPSPRPKRKKHTPSFLDLYFNKSTR